ncbi:unnamed protein product, partial [marine sediment metagenome]
DNTDGLNFYGTLHGGTITEFYDVEVSEIDPGPPEIKTLISTGKVEGGGEYNKGTRKIEVKLKKGISPSLGLSYVYGIFTNGDMTFHGDINISGNIHSNENINVSTTFDWTIYHLPNHLLANSPIIFYLLIYQFDRLFIILVNHNFSN